jgi:hypothetical protein
MKIIYIDLDGVVADFDKGKKEHPLGNVTPYIGRPDKIPGIFIKANLINRPTNPKPSGYTIILSKDF